MRISRSGGRCGARVVEIRHRPGQAGQAEQRQARALVAIGEARAVGGGKGGGGHRGHSWLASARGRACHGPPACERGSGARQSCRLPVAAPAPKPVRQSRGGTADMAQTTGQGEERKPSRRVGALARSCPVPLALSQAGRAGGAGAGPDGGGQPCPADCGAPGGRRVQRQQCRAAGPVFRSRPSSSRRCSPLGHRAALLPCHAAGRAGGGRHPHGAVRPRGRA